MAGIERPTAERLPAGQSSHVCLGAKLPLPFVFKVPSYLPSWQGRHLTHPAWDESPPPSPTGQDVSLYVPRGHSLHEVDPVLGWYLPMSQVLQASASSKVGRCWPVRHVTQVVSPCGVDPG